MSDIKKVQKYITTLARKQLAPTRVIKVNMSEDHGGLDGEPRYVIDIIFDGEQLDGRKLNEMMLAVWQHLWKIDDGHTPFFSFLRPEDEAEHYAPR